MKIYVVRHGQTQWNVQNKVCGMTDVCLTETGKKQAEALADVVENYTVDVILVSPLKRTVETGEIIAKRNNIPIRSEPLLIEQNYGIYEGVDRKDDRFLGNKRNFAYKYPGGESMMQVAYRIYGLIEKIKTQYQNKNVLLVTHGGICRIIKTYFEDMTNDEFFYYSSENCSLEEYEI